MRSYAHVPEYDAFGREIGDDPLASLRDTVAPPEPAPVEAAVAEPVEPVAAPPPARVARPRRRRHGGGLAGLLVLAAVVGAAGLVANTGGVGGDVTDVIGGIAPQEAAPPPTGVHGRSLIRRANFATALKTLQDAGVGRPVMLRVAPDRIDATVVQGRKLHQIQLTADGELRELGSGATAGSRGTVAYGAIDPAAPERITRAGANAKHPPRSIDYVLLTAGPPTTWGAYFKRGRIVIGDPHGSPQRVI
jgi:hypothetical protein